MTVVPCPLAKSYMVLCNSLDYSIPGSSVHGISQIRILEWVAISFSMGSSQPRDWTEISQIVRWVFLTTEPLGKTKLDLILYHVINLMAIYFFFTSSSLPRNEYDLKVKHKVLLTYILLFVTPTKQKI